MEMSEEKTTNYIEISEEKTTNYMEMSEEKTTNYMEISEEKKLQIIWKYLENHKLYGNIGWKTNKLHGPANNLLGFTWQFAGHSSSHAKQFHLLITFVGYFSILLS